MNCHHITPPLPIFIDFYYYYSYLTLALSVLITPLQLYIILTKSAKIKGFKWLILNHSFWCLVFEIFMATVKPVFFPPAISGFPTVLLRDGNFQTTAIATFGCLAMLFNSIAALGATMINRYLLVFPTTNKYSTKFSTVFISFYLIFTYLNLIYIFYPFFIYKAEDYYKMAIDYDPCLQKYLQTESSFMFISHEIAHNGLLLGFILILFLLLGTFVLGIFFIFLIKKQKGGSIAKKQRYLIISAFVQLSITIFFNIVPVVGFIAILCFQITNTENLMLILFSIIATHAFLESLATLYFVTPYRKAIILLYRQIWPVNPSTTVPIDPSGISHSSVPINNISPNF